MRIKKLITSLLLLFFIILSSSSFSQQTVIDSLQKLLSTNIPDSTRSLVLDRLGLFTMTSKPQIALQYAQDGLATANKIDFPKGIARNMNRIGAILRSTGSYPKALEMLLGAKKIAIENNDLESLAGIYNQLGIFYSAQKDSKTAIGEYYKGMAIVKKINNANIERLLLSNLGMDYGYLEKLDSARICTYAAYDMALKQKSNNINVLLMNLASFDFRSKKYNLALEYYHQSIPYSKKVEDFGILSQTYYEMAKVFKKINRADSCLYYAQKSFEIGRSINNLNSIHEASLLLSELYEKNDIKKSYYYFRQATAAKDSMFSQQKVKQIQNISFNENLRQQELIAAEKELKDKQKTIILLSIMSVFLILAVILYRNNRLKNKSNELLKSQKEEINVQRNKAENALTELKSTQNQLIQKEKLASLGELTAGIAHEIQNPLNFVNNFSELSIELANELKEEIGKVEIPENDKEYIDEILNDLAQNQEKIGLHGKRASSIVSNMLEHSRSSTGERQMTDVNKLADEYLRLSYHGMRAKNKSFNADFKLICDENLPLINIIQQDIGRVLLNLINNAFYAAAQSVNPYVLISTKLDGQNILIEVSDNGRGIPVEVLSKIFQPFFTTKPTGEGTGLGLSLSYDIITKGNNGKIEVKSKVGEGTTFTVYLPIAK